MKISGYGAGSTGTPTASAGRVNRSEMDKMDFLQILVTQLRYQDPMKPMDDREFATQLAQFSSLEQISEQTRWSKMTYGLGLIGQEVTFAQEEGGITTAIVKALRTVDGAPLLSVGDTEITLDQIIQAAGK